MTWVTERERPADRNLSPYAQGVRREPWVAPTVAEWVALVAALAPLVVVVIWAVTTGWSPLGDSAQIITRSRDVFTQHHPFVGAWSSSSQDIGEDLNNLGPLYMDLLAPFTRIHPSAGAAVGVGLVNIGAVIGVWAVARRMFGSVGAVGAMIATLLLEASAGTQAWLEARQQLALVLPFWCLLWLLVAVWDGRAWAIPPTAFVASVIVQTHFTYAYQVLVLLIGVAIASIPGRWRRPQHPSLALMMGWGGIVLALCWIQPIWDQLFGYGNLGHVLGQGGGGKGGSSGVEAMRPGVSGGIELMARTSLRPPFTLPDSMGHALGDVPVTGRVHGTAGGWTTVALWAGAVLAVYLVSRHRGRTTDAHRSIEALAGVGLVALLGAWLAAGLIPPGAFSVVPPQNYYWMWPVGLLLTCAIVGFGVGELVHRAPASARWAEVVGCVVLVGLALSIVHPDTSIGYLDREANQEQAAAQRLEDQFATAVERTGLRGPVVIDFGRDLAFTTHRYNFLSQLQSMGIQFTFDAQTADLRRFGEHRCERGRARYRIYVESGRGVDPPKPGEVVMARIRDGRGQPVAIVAQRVPRVPDDIRAQLVEYCIQDQN